MYVYLLLSVLPNQAIAVVREIDREEKRGEARAYQ